MILDYLARLIDWLSPKMVTLYAALIAVFYFGLIGYVIFTSHGWARAGYIAFYSVTTLFIFWDRVAEWSRSRLRKKRRAEIAFKATDISEE